MPNEEAARAVHDAYYKHRYPDSDLPWEGAEPWWAERCRLMAAAVLAADPDRAALLRLLGADLDYWVDKSRLYTGYERRRAVVQALEAIKRDRPHLLDAARGQEGQHGA